MTDKAGALTMLSERLLDWRELADYLGIKNTERAKFNRGREVIEIIDWLEQRNRGGELANALEQIGRTDLLSIAVEIFSHEEANSESIRVVALESKRTALVRLNVTAWAEQVKKTSRTLPDRLLQRIEFQEREELFASLDRFLDLIFKSGRSIELYNDRHENSELIADKEQFWVRVLTALITGRTKRPLGSWKWFIGETVKEIGSNEIDRDSMTNKVWEYILFSYCDLTSDQCRRTNVLSDILSAALTSASDLSSPAKKASFLFSFVNFLFAKLRDDAESIKQILNYLREYHERFGHSESPVFLERLKRLIGIGANIAFDRIDDIPAFTTKLARIEADELCGYAFETMIHPLTVLEVSSLTGIPLKDAGENAEYPYVFKAVSDKGSDIFNSLIAEIESIVGLATEYEPDERFEWDVPTIGEWIVFSSCGHQPFPWGNDELTPERANFDFGKRSRLRPIGSYPLGTSEFGIHDCFGNVHEIIRVSSTNRFPQDFRLAGGCYQTHSRLAIPRFIRGFRTRQPETRRNIGIRLVRYNQRDRATRFRNLRAYKANYRNNLE